MNLLGVLGSVPKGYSDSEDSRMKRLLEQQTYDTNTRQAPMQDQLLRAQIDHLRRTAAQSGLAQRLAQQQREAQIGGANSVIESLIAGGGTTPMPQAPQPQLPQNMGPNPVPTTPIPNPGGGVGAMGATLPPAVAAGGSGTGGFPMLPPPQGVPSSDPLGGGGAMPSATPQDPRMDQLRQMLIKLQTNPNPAQRAAGLQTYLALQEAMSKTGHRDLMESLADERVLNARDNTGIRRQQAGYNQQRGNEKLNLTKRGQDLGYLGRDFLATGEQRAKTLQDVDSKYSPQQAKANNALMSLPQADKDTLTKTIADRGYKDSPPVDTTITLPSGTAIRAYKGDDGQLHIELMR